MSTPFAIAGVTAVLRQLVVEGLALDKADIRQIPERHRPCGRESAICVWLFRSVYPRVALVAQGL